jgi:hypothetical protein
MWQNGNMTRPDWWERQQEAVSTDKVDAAPNASVSGPHINAVKIQQ